MRFSPRTITLLWDVHAWAGVITSLVLAMMFFCGSITLFHHEIEAWQDPAIAPDDLAAADAALARIDPASLDGKPVAVAPPSDHAAQSVLYLPGRDPLVLAEPARGQRSKVGALFFQLHFLWHESFPQGMQIAGLFGVLLLLALVTGLVIHWRDLRRQAFRFRPGLRARYGWSDLHKVLGVWGLPFQAMIAFTAAVIGLGAVIVPPTARSAFDGDLARGQAEIYGKPAPAPAVDAPAAMRPFTDLAARATAALPGMVPTYIAIDRYGRTGARATVWGDLDDDRFHPGANVVLGADDGAFVSRSVDDTSPAWSTMYVIYGVHFATYGGLGVKLVYFLLGIAGWLTILSGNWIFVERRATRRPSLGTALLARLTLGAGGGLPVAAAATLWINRLVAPSEARPALEVWGFFAVWALLTVGALLVPVGRRSWAGLLAAAGAAAVAVPVLSLLTSPVGLMTVDLGVAIVGAGFLVAARGVWRRRTVAAVVPS